MSAIYNFEIERKKPPTKKEIEDFIKWMFESKEIRNFVLTSKSSKVCAFYEKNKKVKLTAGFVTYHKNKWIKIYDEIYELEKIKTFIYKDEIWNIIKENVIM